MKYNQFLNLKREIEIALTETSENPFIQLIETNISKKAVFQLTAKPFFNDFYVAVSRVDERRSKFLNFLC